RAQTKLTEPQRIDLGPHGRSRAAANLDQADAINLGDFLSEDRIGHVIHLRLRGRIGGQAENQYGRLGRVNLAPVRIARKVGWQLTASGIDGRLHVTRRAVDIAAEIKNQNNLGRADLARGSHLGYARYTTEHALERRGHGGGHGFGAGSRQLGRDEDDWIDHVRQWGDGEHAVGQDTRQQQRNGEQRSRYRTTDEWSRNIHRQYSLRLIARLRGFHPPSNRLSWAKVASETIKPDVHDRSGVERE